MLSVLYAYETYGQPTIVHHDTVNVVETKFFARDTIYCLARLMDSTGVAGYKRICPPHQSNWESIDYLMVDKAHRKEKEINILRIHYVVTMDIDSLYSYNIDAIYTNPVIGKYSIYTYSVDELCIDATQAFWLRAFGIDKLDALNLYFLNPIMDDGDMRGYELLVILDWRSQELSFAYSTILIADNPGLRIGKNIIGMVKPTDKVKLQADGNRLLSQHDRLCMDYMSGENVAGIYYDGARFLWGVDCILHTRRRYPQGSVYSLLTSICNEASE